MDMKKKRSWPYRVGAAAAVVATAVSGTRSTDPESDWYLDLAKPDWQPPGWAFPVAWTALYADIAAVSGEVLTRTSRSGDRKAREKYARELAGNLILNAGWSHTFFKGQQLGPGVVVAAALAVSSARLSRQAGKQGPGLGWALKPYVAWTTFAAALSFEIWRLNREEY